MHISHMGHINAKFGCFTPCKHAFQHFYQTIIEMVSIKVTCHTISKNTFFAPSVDSLDSIMWDTMATYFTRDKIPNFPEIW